MVKYRMATIDIVDSVKDILRRLSILERNPRASQTSIDSGSLVINGGLLEVKSTDMTNTSPLFIVFGATQSGVPNQVSITRSTKVNNLQHDAFRFTDGSGVGSGGGSIAILDRYGNNIISDAYASDAHGMSDPRLYATFYDPNTFTTFTSGTFSNYRSSYWYIYHPNLRVRVLCQVDVGTTGEVRVNESGGSQQDIATLTSGMFAYVDLTVDRRNTQNGNGPNGNVATLDLEVRRTSGAGNVKVAFVEAIGLDLSNTW